MRRMIRKVSFALLSFFIASAAFSQYDWEWVNPLPQGNALFDLHLFDKNRAIVCGEFGTVLTTTDGGKNWQVRHEVAGEPDRLERMAFGDDHRGIALGARKKAIYLTEDGGESWSKVYQCSISENLWDAVFLNPDTVIVVGDGPIEDEARYHIVLRSTDGGHNWERLEDGENPRIRHISRINGHTLAGIGSYTYNQSFFRSEDAGLNWQEIDMGEVRIFQGIDFVDENHGCLVGDYYGWTNGNIAFTHDSGLTWQRSSFNNRFWWQVQGIDKDHWWIMGDSRFARTSDGGKTWREFMMPSGSWSRFSAADTNTVMAVTSVNAAIIRTDDGGKTWQYLSEGEMNNLISLSFSPDNLTGLAVGGYGTILRTLNCGQSWTKQNSNTSSELREVQFSTPSIATAIGSRGAILRTTDGGQTWKEQNSGTKKDLIDVFFLAPDSGFVLCERSDSLMLLHTTDGGEHWRKITTNILNIFPRAFSFNDHKNGWLVTSGGELYHSKDGGFTWHLKFDMKNTTTFRDIKFFNSRTGYIIGGGWNEGILGGVILRTNDAGDNWIRLPSVALYSLYTISQSDSLHLTILSGNCILSSDNGGSTWELLSTPTNNDFFDIHVFNQNHSIIVGSGGTILLRKAGLNNIENKRNSEQPIYFLLHQNYPNPFKISTVFSFTLFEPSVVKIEIYNTRGQLVTSLPRKSFSSGHHRFEWNKDTNSSNRYNDSLLPSGLYFFRLMVYPNGKNEIFSQVIKFILL